MRRLTLEEQFGADEERSAVEADIVEIARRDVFFSPPVILHGRGSFLRYTSWFEMAQNLQ